MDRLIVEKNCLCTTIFYLIRSNLTSNIDTETGLVELLIADCCWTLARFVGKKKGLC